MTRPLWADPTVTPYGPLRDDISVDVAIIGGGFSGLGAAWALAREDVRAVVLEAQTVASGASGRNAGFVLMGPAAGYSGSATRIGPKGTAGIWDLTRENAALFGEIIEEHRLDVGYARRGSMSLAASQDEWEELQREQVALDGAGVSCCLIESIDLPRPFHTMYRGGIYHAGNAEIDPGAFLRSVARIASERVSIYEGSRVLGVESDSPWLLRTSSGTVRADSVIVCTNAWTSQLLPAVPVTPVRGQVLATHPLDRVVVPFPMYANRGYQYWRQTVNGRLVLGGWRDMDVAREVGLDEALHPEIQQALSTFATLVTEGDAKVEFRWAGIMGFTPDGFPLVGKSFGQPNLFLATGYNGHGVSMAFVCGMRIARAAIGQEMAIPKAFAPSRFQS